MVRIAVRPWVSRSGMNQATRRAAPGGQSNNLCPAKDAFGLFESSNRHTRIEGGVDASMEITLFAICPLHLPRLHAYSQTVSKTILKHGALRRLHIAVVMNLVTGYYFRQFPQGIRARVRNISPTEPPMAEKSFGHFRVVHLSEDRINRCGLKVLATQECSRANVSFRQLAW
jgi:hypothetical protein